MVEASSTPSNRSSRRWGLLSLPAKGEQCTDGDRRTGQACERCASRPAGRIRCAQFEREPLSATETGSFGVVAWVDSQAHKQAAVFPSSLSIKEKGRDVEVPLVVRESK